MTDKDTQDCKVRKESLYRLQVPFAGTRNESLYEFHNKIELNKAINKLSDEDTLNLIAISATGDAHNEVQTSVVAEPNITLEKIKERLKVKFGDGPISAIRQLRKIRYDDVRFDKDPRKLAITVKSNDG
jgi:hypothetical protein